MAFASGFGGVFTLQRLDPLHDCATILNTSFNRLPSISHQLTINVTINVMMDLPPLQRLSPPAVTVLVCFLAYSSQFLFHHLEPGPLQSQEAYVFNASVVSLLICYWRTCLTHPGRIPQDWHETLNHTTSAQRSATQAAAQSNRWCRKCEAFKPPRAHHCKSCKQ
jgi:palmitoyltransferase